MRKNLLLASLIAISFSACTKSDTDLQPKNPEALDKHLLVASVVTDYGNGTYEINYNYDEQNRLTGMQSKVTGNAYGDVANHVYEYYQGNLLKSTITRSGIKYIFNYLYTNGVPMTVGYSSPDDNSQAHTIATTAEGSFLTDYNISASNGELAKTKFTYANGNKIKEVNQSLSNTGAVNFTLTFDEEYGTKKNPYLYSGSKWLLPDVPFANKNELLKETSSNNGAIRITTYTNSYNKQGYPVTAQASVVTESGTTHSTITYKYIAAK